MRLLLLSGLGPSFYNEDLLASSLFDSGREARLAEEHCGGVRLGDLSFERNGSRHDLLRPLPGRGGTTSLPSDALIDKPAPHLTTWTIESILAGAALDHVTFDLAEVWRGEPAPGDDVDIVLLSTTFIWDRASLATAIAWVADNLPDRGLVLGGQYSNLKHAQIMAAHPAVDCIVRGDGEVALPLVVAALRRGTGFEQVPNLVFRRRDDGDVATTPLEYVDMDRHPSPGAAGEHRIVPYESMRGCPFGCRFCSFPHASPKWRYKSAAKIARDWATYAEVNGTVHVRAYDSTFPTPPRRLRELLRLLPATGVGWEAFARANSIKDDDTVDGLVAARCRMLTFGFESMSASTLDLMKKQVRVADNRLAFELLRGSELGYRASFMVGYPGERPEDFEQTRRFLADEYEGHFLLNVFSLMDETMPVWADAERLELKIEDPENADRGWSHVGMDLATASTLMTDTLDEVRWRNDRAVHLLWQQRYERPLMPHRPAKVNLRVEKLVDRLAMVPARRGATSADNRARSRALLSELAREGVRA